MVGGCFANYRHAFDTQFPIGQEDRLHEEGLDVDCFKWTCSCHHVSARCLTLSRVKARGDVRPTMIGGMPIRPPRFLRLRFSDICMRESAGTV